MKNDGKWEMEGERSVGKEIGAKGGERTEGEKDGEGREEMGKGRVCPPP